MPDINSKWDAELEKRGVVAITAILVGGGVGTGQHAQFPLFPHSGTNPDRAYVEAWLGRKAVEAATTEASRHQDMMKPAEAAARWAFWACIIGGATFLVTLAALLVSLRAL